MARDTSPLLATATRVRITRAGATRITLALHESGRVLRKEHALTTDGPKPLHRGWRDGGTGAHHLLARLPRYGWKVTR